MMDRTLDTIAPGSRVAVIRLRSLGDCVLTTPALDLLHAYRPDLSLGVVVEDRFRAVFEHHPAVSTILSPSLADVRRFQPEMVINFHGGTRSSWMTLGSGARIRAGFGHHVGSQAYNLRIPRAQEILGEERPVHTAEHLASAMFYLGVPRVEIPRASLYVSDAGREEQGSYAVMHPFASAPDKAWHVDRFVSLAGRLGTQVVVLAGPQDDVAPFAKFRVYQSAPLDTVKRLLRDAALFVGNDSGPAHMAAAFNVPCVVLFGPTNPETWGPWRAPSKILKGFENHQVDDCLRAADELVKVRA